MACKSALQVLPVNAIAIHRLVHLELAVYNTAWLNFRMFVTQSALPGTGWTYVWLDKTNDDDVINTENSPASR